YILDPWFYPLIEQYSSYKFILFFFQAEDGIRHRNVTGVQTCALPISLVVVVVVPTTTKVPKSGWPSSKAANITNNDKGAAKLFHEFISNWWRRVIKPAR